MTKKYTNPKVKNFPVMMPIRVSAEMHHKLKDAAARREWDLSKLVRHALGEFIYSDEGGTE